MNHNNYLSQYCVSQTYAKCPEVESECTTQEKPRQDYGTVVVGEIEKNYFSGVTFKYFYSDSRKVPRIKAGVLTPVSSTPLVYS